MAGAGEGEQFGGNFSGLEAVDQPDRLLVGHVLVFGAMNAEGGSGSGSDPVERARQDVPATFLLDIPPEEQREHLGGVDALAIRLGEVAGAIDVHHAADSARLIGVPARPFELGDPGSDRQELRQVPTRRAPGGADAVGIDVVLLGIGPQPADGRLDVVYGGGELVLGGQPIADRHGNVAPFRQLEAEGVVGVAMTGAESAAMDADHGGERTGSVAWAGEVDLQVLVVGIRVLDASQPLHRLRNHQFLGRQGGGQPRQQGESPEGPDRQAAPRNHHPPRKARNSHEGDTRAGTVSRQQRAVCEFAEEMGSVPEPPWVGVAGWGTGGKAVGPRTSMGLDSNCPE